MNLVLDHLDRWASLKKNRFQWENYWQELAEILHPIRADITLTQTPGADRHSIIYDGAPMRARRGLATAIDGLLKPKTSIWFHVRAQDEDLNEDEEVRRWLSFVERRMWNAIYAKASRFIQRSGEVDNDLVTFGIGVLFVGENQFLNNLIFKSIHPKDAVIDENGDGVVDTLYHEMMLTPRQAVYKFGENNVGKRTKEAYRNKHMSQQKIGFVQCVYPRTDRSYKSRRNTDFPFASLIIDKESEHIVEESGFIEFPFAVPRWETATGEVYGRSPGMVALPDSKTLQAMGKTLLVAGQKAVDPPIWTLDDSVIGAVRTFPGGISVIDSDAMRSTGGRPPLGPIDFGKNIPLGLEMQNRVQLAVEAAFFQHVFNLPIDGPQMTATEILERKEEFIRTIGPVFGQLEADYIGHIVERSFGIMLRANAFGEPPDILKGRDIRFEFQSPIQRARRQIEATATVRALELMAPFIQADPRVMDNFDGDKIIRDMPDAFGMPLEWLRSQDAVGKLRQFREEQAGQAQALAAQEQMANTTKTLAEAQQS